MRFYIHYIAAVILFLCSYSNMTSTKRSYRWCFTLNNYTVEEITQLHEGFQENAKYWIYGKEVGASGTPHLQGYVEWKNAKSLSATKKAINNRAHVEIAKKPKAANVKYCKKDGDWSEIDTGRVTKWKPTKEWAYEEFKEHMALMTDEKWERLWRGISDNGRFM